MPIDPASAATPPRLYLGLISGTSADGIDAALVCFEPTLQVLAARTFAYPEAVRSRLLALAQSHATITLDDYGQLDTQVGACFADAALALLADAGVAPNRVTAIGSHGQTVCHRPLGPQPFSLQIGNAHCISERSGILTVADFRRADMAAGGQGAPLLPSLHAAVLADPLVARAVLNLGGIANLTLLIPGQPVIGFDTGPANCLLDAWAQRHLGSACDAGGAWAARGHVNAALLARLLDEAYFSAAPPKSTGREVFNLNWLDAQLPPGLATADVQATLLQLSVRSIVAGLHGYAPAELYVCGGGVHNDALMAALRAALADMRVDTTAALGLDPDFLEAIGFAWLARQRLLGLPGNLPSVTGARGPRLLGTVFGNAGQLCA